MAVKLKKIVCMMLAFILLVGTLRIPASAAELENTAPKTFVINILNTRATGSFNMTIPAKTRVLADSSFPLAAGETVTIKASYSPFSASVDIGLLAPNGVFYYFNVISGSVDQTIQVDETGRYTLQVRNNSSAEVSMSGFVNY